MPYSIQTDAHSVTLTFTSDEDNYDWVDAKRPDEEFTVLKTFTLLGSDRTRPVEEESGRTFTIGTLVGDYFTIPARILEIRNDLRIHRDIRISVETFVAPERNSIFALIDKLTSNPIIIGGEEPEAIPAADFAWIQKRFPTQTEISHYKKARVSGVISQYMSEVTDSQANLERYLNRRLGAPRPNSIAEIRRYELGKYQFLLAEMRTMMASAETFSEADWQARILEIITLLYPKYITALKEVHVTDFYSTPGRTHDRRIDIAVVDANGNLDIIEIKKPFEDCIIARSQYRDNFTPMRDLSGTIMQVEKYLFHLNKWGVDGERVLQARHRASLPDGMSIKVTNPKAMIIMGRSNNLTPAQLFDFEIIKRKYANIMDIITYDDLIARLTHTVQKLQATLAPAVPTPATPSPAIQPTVAR